MSSFDPHGGTPRNDEATLLDAVADVELDSTGAGSPPPATLEQPLHGTATNEQHLAQDYSGAQSADASVLNAGTLPHHIDASHATHSTLEAALGETLVISGGSGYNDLVGATPGATYVMPISDNGGSSSEIIRVLGGPSIGDLRSRLNRLIPLSSRQDSSAPPPASNEAIHALLSYRLPSHNRSREIKQEWMDILEGRHPLWRGIEPERKEVIRGFLVHFESEVLRRAHRHFNFRGGSIGNFFLAAAQKFFRSIQSAIFLFAATTMISTSGVLGGKVLPVINTNHTATIAAELENGEVVVGQCEISHPAPKRSSTGKRGMSGPDKTQAAGLSLSASALQHEAEKEGLLGVEAAQGLGPADGGLSTPGFGPPAHFQINEPFASNYTSMNASLDAFKIGTTSDSDLQRGSSSMGRQGASSTPARSAAGPSPLFAQLVDERAAAYAAQTRKGLTTVGNLKDGLDPEDDDLDSQDGNDQVDSPRDSSAAEEDQPHNSNALPSFKLSEASLPRRTKSARKENAGNIIFSKAEDEASEPALPSRSAGYSTSTHIETRSTLPPIPPL